LAPVGSAPYEVTVTTPGIWATAGKTVSMQATFNAMLFTVTLIMKLLETGAAYKVMLLDIENPFAGD
jgi:hypothetical protein